MKSLLRGFFILYYVYPSVLLPCAVALTLGLVSIPLGSKLLALISLVWALTSLYFAFLARSDIQYLRREMPPPESLVVLNIRAPVLLAPGGKDLDLGDRPVKKRFEILAIAHNIGGSPATGIHLSVREDDEGFRFSPTSVGTFDLEPGEAKVFEFSIIPVTKSEKKSTILVTVEDGNRRDRKALMVRSRFSLDKTRPIGCSISRWRYGLSAATAWRGDIDGFDNLSNEKTLQPALDLSGIFRIPPSLFISSRLILDQKEWFSWVRKFPEKMEGENSVQRFENWLGFLRTIRACNDLEYPLIGQTWPCAQIGSHMYYHYWSPYGYDASLDTNWDNNIGPGEYAHSWEIGKKDEKTTFTEILDNISLNNTYLEDFFGVRPSTWSAPADKSHSLYPEALAKAGLLGASEAFDPGARLGRSLAPYRPDLGECMPYHPGGSKIVETRAHTRRFDPFTPTHVFCLKRAIMRAVRRGSQVTYLWHPHLRLYSPFFGRESSVRHFVEVSRFLVQDLGSVCWITTHHNIVQYWESVLCPDHGVVHLKVVNGLVSAFNESENFLKALPIDVEYGGGKRTCFLVDLEPNSSKEVD